MLSSRWLTTLLMLMAVSVLITSGVNATELSQDQVPLPVSGSRRMLLRGATEADADNEDRGGFSWLRQQYWLETEKSKSYVKQALSLDGLEGAALKAAPNFVHYDDFVYARQGNILKNWLDEGLTTPQLAKHYKLNDIPAIELKKDTNKYKKLVRFAKMEDEKIFNLRNSDVDVKMVNGGSPAEMEAKLEAWVSARRPRYYVRKMLNLDNRSRKTLLGSKYYSYYGRFLRLTGQKPTLPQKPAVEA
uniref:Avh230 n=1 Tax=Phytophthora sojae TaxID=67593 RepID=G1FS97_PHYSO|nr:Avh230 [Phytophthora sojae]